MTDITLWAERLYCRPLAIEAFKNEVICEFARERILGERRPRKVDAVSLDLKQSALADDASFYDTDGNRRPFRSDGPIATIDIRGTLVQKGGWVDADSGLVGYDWILRQAKAAAADSKIRGTFIRWDSGGGEVSGLFAAAEELASLSKAEGGKPIYHYLDERACSAAYVMCSTGDRVFGRREAQGGSLAAIINFLDKSRMYEKMGLESVVIRAKWADRKARGIAGEPVDDELLVELEGMVDDASEQIVEFVAAMRGIAPQSIRDLRGRVLLGPDLAKVGLIDEIASEQKAWDALLEETRSA